MQSSMTTTVIRETENSKAVITIQVLISSSFKSPSFYFNTIYFSQWIAFYFLIGRLSFTLTTFIYELNFRVLSKAGQIDRLHPYEHDFVGLVSQPREIISFEEVHFKMFCPPVRTNYLPADNGDL